MASRLVPQHVRKALDLLHADLTRAWTVDEIASACGLSRRTLHRQFRRFVGRTPIAYLRALRLDKARHEMLRRIGGVNVTDIALGSGFCHLGRFAARYRERFGESPSATLRRGDAVVDRDRSRARALLGVERPTLAVLPFRPSGHDARRAIDIADDIVGALIRSRWVAVAEPHRARYQVRGRIADDGAERASVSVILVDASTGRYLWADRWDGDCDDAGVLGERVASRIAAALQRPVREAEIDRARRCDPAQLNAWELTMLALPRVLKVEATECETALEWLNKAMMIVPHDALPISLAAWCHGLRGCHNFSPRPEHEKTAASTLARRAAELGPEDALSETFLAAGYTLAHDLPTAAFHADRALALDGGSAWAWGRSGWIKAYEGNATEAIERFQIARTFAPVDPQNFLWSVGIAAGHFAKADYAQSARWFERALAENPAAVWINHALAPAYAFTGCPDRAQRSLTELLGSFPELTIAKVRDGLPYPSDFLDRVAEGLETTGMRPQ